MKMSEIKVGHAYAYNPRSIRLADEDTVRVVVVKADVTFVDRSWRGEVSRKGFRVRLPDGKTENVEARRLLSTWSGCVKWRAERKAENAARERRHKAHDALCKRLQRALRAVVGHDDLEVTGWNDFEVHVGGERSNLNEDETLTLSRKFVEAVETMAEVAKAHS